MTKTSRLSAILITSLGMVLALSAANPVCLADFVYFDGGPTGLGTAFLDGVNWDPDGVPGANLVDILGIDDGFSSTLSDGSARVRALRVGSAAKEHQFSYQDTRFGRFTMTDGSLEVIGSAALGLFVVGRERENEIFGGDYNKNSIVDAADYTVWRDTLGSTSDLRADGDQNGSIEAVDYEFWKNRFGNVVRGGEIILTGNSTLTANGVIVGERTEGLLSVGPNAIADFRNWVSIDNPPHFGGTEDIRIGNYGPAFDDFGAEPGLDGKGVVVVQGTLNAKDLYMSEHGAKGEIRLSGGTVNLNGALIMNLCDNCVTDPDLLARRSAKVSIIGSSGTFNVGLDPDPSIVDPMPPSRDMLANSPTAVFSFTADAGGVAPITVVDNGVETSGIANIDGAKLELSLDAFPFTPTSKVTLIDAIAGNLSGQFGQVTFLGNTTAEVRYDNLNGDVFLDNFQSTAGATAPGPSESTAIFLTVTDLGLNANSNREWLVEVMPDPALFTSTPDGVGGSLEVELAFEVTGSDLLAATKNGAAWPNDNPGNNPFTSGISLGVQTDLAEDTVFASLGSELFTTGAAVEVLTIETMGSGPTTLSWGGQTLLPGSELSYTGSRIAQAGSNFDGYQGSLSAGGPTCDFNGDGQCTGSDIDMLVAEIAAGTNNGSFDLTGDGQVNTADRDAWLADAGALNLVSGNAYLLGDATLDGTVDGQDFIEWNTHKFANTAAWTAGDFNADGVVDGQDFILWNTHKFMSSDQAAAAVPEPVGILIWLGLAGVALLHRRN